ncbi:PREDICTED: paramyosin-like [Branchiostoma belcheri]|uniref:Paramyosin-like n=1 Tax=Branchiostoma belcheri TaxID=7741 RepID=A0A6P4ZBB3_BRABE|nr:PREDICTED: paramyosin-like [Branchiostoma belcheri]
MPRRVALPTASLPHPKKIPNFCKFGEKFTPTMTSKSGSLRRSSSGSKLNKSGSNLAPAFSKSLRSSTSDLGNIEAEYIKNLQQQVYFLELEANFLRDQAKKATDIHPRMTAEAERMLRKLRDLQSEVDGLSLEIRRKESHLDMLSTEKSRVESKLVTTEDAYSREKRLLMDEIVSLRKLKEVADRDITIKDRDILALREQLTQTQVDYNNANHKIKILQTQLDQRAADHKVTQYHLEEKRADLLKTQSALSAAEDRYYTSTAAMAEAATKDLREETRLLRIKLKDHEMSSDQDRFLRNKMSDDLARVTKENALLGQQVAELNRQLDRERHLREDKETREASKTMEVMSLQDHERQLKFEIETLRNQLEEERAKVRNYMDQVRVQEELGTSVRLEGATAKSQLRELEGIHTSTNVENSQLRRDKALLVDHVAELQKQLTVKEEEILRLRNHVYTLQGDVDRVRSATLLESSIQAQKWDEISRLTRSLSARSLSPDRY